MSERPATRTEILLIGTVATAFGFYFCLVGLSMLPIPGGPQNLHAPLWVVFAAGLAFLLAGTAVLMHGTGLTDNNRELPPHAPYTRGAWLRVFQFLIGFVIFVCFGAMMSYVAFWPGEREFSGSGLFGGPVSALAGRIGFGIVAIIAWACAIVVAVSGLRKSGLLDLRPDITDLG